MGANKKPATPKARSLPKRNDVVEVPADAKYDLSKCVIRLTELEVIKFTEGVSLKDLYQARKSAKVDPEIKIEEENIASANESIRKQVDDILAEI